jgi:uncharacterized protein (DUF2237 family)
MRHVLAAALEDDMAPQVVLGATHESALQIVLEDLKQYAIDAE